MTNGMQADIKTHGPAIEKERRYEVTLTPVIVKERRYEVTLSRQNLWREWLRERGQTLHLDSKVPASLPLPLLYRTRKTKCIQRSRVLAPLDTPSQTAKSLLAHRILVPGTRCTKCLSRLGVDESPDSPGWVKPSPDDPFAK